MSTTAQARIPAIKNYYVRRVIPERLDTIQFRTLLMAKTGPLAIDGLGTSVEWVDDNAVLHGTLQLQRPQFYKRRLHVGHGNSIRLDVKWGKSWRELWRMRVWDPEEDLMVGNGALSCPLYDDLTIIERSRDDFRYVKHKKHRPRGWRTHEIVIDVAKRYGIPLGKIAKGTRWIKSLVMRNVSPLDVIVRAYRLEREHSGRRFFMRWVHGKLHILPLQRNPVLYVLKDAFLSVSLSSKSPEHFATAITGRGRLRRSRSKKSEKIAVNIDRNVGQFGYIHRQMDLGVVESRKDAEQEIKRRLARLQRIEQTVTITHPGIPWVRRGDAIDVEIPERGFTDERAIMWVGAITHSLDGSNYMMSPTLNMDDPLKNPEKARKDRDRRSREKKRTQREREADVGGAAAPV